MRLRRARDPHGMRLTVAAVLALLLCCVASLASTATAAAAAAVAVVAADSAAKDGDKPATIEADDYEDVEDDDSGTYAFAVRTHTNIELKHKCAQSPIIITNQYASSGKHLPDTPPAAHLGRPECSINPT